MWGFAQELEKYKPDSAEEEVARGAFLRLLGADETPWVRGHFEPGHVTASVFVASRTARKTMLLAHKKLNRWLQPGGHIDEGIEAVEGAALRELFEETGLKVEASEGLFDLDIQDIPANAKEVAHKHYDARVLVIVEGTPVFPEAQETEVRWFSKSEAMEAARGDAGNERAMKKLEARGLLA